MNEFPFLCDILLETMNNDSADANVLLTFVTINDDGSHKINIYGTPGGLRQLASALLKQADVDQSSMHYLRDYDTDHTHYKPSHTNGILAQSSDEIQLGRLDLRNGELAYWAKQRIETSADSPDTE